MSTVICTGGTGKSRVRRFKDTKKTKESLGNVGIIGFVFTNFQADNYGTSSGDDECYE